jgi:hypothetical protein
MCGNPGSVHACISYVCTRQIINKLFHAHTLQLSVSKVCGTVMLAYEILRAQYPTFVSCICMLHVGLNSSIFSPDCTANSLNLSGQ